MNFAVTESMDSICCCFTASIICVTANVQLFAPALTSVYLWLIIYCERKAPNLAARPGYRKGAGARLNIQKHVVFWH